jgi:hypothetical protein
MDKRVKILKYDADHGLALVAAGLKDGLQVGAQVTGYCPNNGSIRITIRSVFPERSIGFADTVNPKEENSPKESPALEASSIIPFFEKLRGREERFPISLAAHLITRDSFGELS